MKRQFLGITAGLALAASGLVAQSAGQGASLGYALQQAGTIGTTTETRTVTATYSFIGSASTVGGPVVASRPVAATEERKTVQTLADGTELVNSNSTQFYRDAMGRTRVEETLDGVTLVTIRDPVAGFVVRLDPRTKNAVKATTASGGGRSGGGSTASTAAQEDLKKKAEEVQKQVAKAQKEKTAPEPAMEDLGIESVSGVPALHTRMTRIIPAGSIGNNRDIHVVNERWYSEDLQMLLKSVSSDPRFGVTTYELSNVLRNDPDPTLFKIPADYAVTEAPGRGVTMQMVPAKQ